MERHWKNDSMEMMTQLSKAKEKVLKLQKEVKKARDAEVGKIYMYMQRVTVIYELWYIVLCFLFKVFHCVHLFKSCANSELQRHNSIHMPI